MRKVLLNLPKKLDYKFISKLEQEKLTDSEYILKLIVNDLDSKINLGEGFYYYKYLEKFYNGEKKEVVFSLIEKKLLITLLESEELIVPVDILIKKVWKKSGVSIFSFRNKIKSIRVKTYYNLIKNHPSIGYSINLKNASYFSN